MRLVSLKEYSESYPYLKSLNPADRCICIINDHQYDDNLAKEIAQSMTKAYDSDILILTKGTSDGFHYLKPFYYITYNDKTDRLYQEISLLRSNEAHRNCLDLITESLIYSLIQGTKLLMIEKHIDALNFTMKSGGCILFDKSKLSDDKKIQIQLFLYITKGITCIFHEHKKAYIAFLFSENQLEIADNKEIALFLHSLGFDKKDTGVSAVKHKPAQLHDAYVEALLDFENQNADTTAVLIQDNAINYTLSLLSERMTRSIEERNADALHQSIEDYMEFLYQLKSIHRVEVTTKLLHQLYERFYLIKNAQPIRDMIKETEYSDQITSELEVIYNILKKILNDMMNMMSEKGIEQNALVNQIYEYVKVNYRKPLALKEVADAFHVTPQYVCKLFNGYTSTNFSSLLTYFRIYHAKLLLKSGLTIKEVADVCGFRDVSYFMKKFKSVTGVTANEFKNNSAKY